MAIAAAPALVGAAFAMPAVGAEQAVRGRAAANDAPVAALSFNHFTPAAADPKLAALLARSGLDGQDFHFTPAQSHRASPRAVTVAVRARSVAAVQDARLVRTDIGNPATVGLKPIAYNLGVAVGWKRFAVSGDVTRIDLSGVPGSRETADVGVSYSGKRFVGRVVASADRPLADTPKAGSDGPSYSVDVGGSYTISRRIDLTAGVRYKSQNFRLDRLTDDRRDSQAVYVGTALRF
ncbi:porin [Sphingomonas sp. GlSt437]|uniref:porin n=1 Tax=Sphingomonas sp. GlSt437 TaxID=3389970 RepID=UPI003EBE3620